MNPASPDTAFRAAMPGEAKALEALAREIWPDAYGKIISAAQIDYMLSRMYAPDVIAREVGEGICWDFILRDERPCGYLSYGLVNAATVKIHKLYLLADARGVGLAARALSRVETWARARKARQVTLNVNRANHRAIRAYEKAGFSRARELVVEIGNGYVMDDYVMEKIIGPRGAP